MAIFLTGCMDVVQELWIEPDGSAECSMQISMSQLLVEAGGKDELAELIQKAHETSSDEIEVIDAADGVIDDIHYYVYHIKTANINNCLGQDSAQIVTMNLSPSQRNRILYTQKFDYHENNAVGAIRVILGTTDWGDSVGLLSNAMQSKLLKDHYWTVKVHVPGEITDTNGQYDKESQTVTWRLALDQVMVPDAEPVILKLEYLPRGTELSWVDQFGNTGIILAIICSFSLGAFVLGLIVILKQKRQQKQLAKPHKNIKEQQSDNSNITQ